MEPTKMDDKRIDLSACLEAVSMYNGDYHRDRDNYNPPLPLPEPLPEPEPKPRLVPYGEYLRGVIVKGIHGLLRAGVWIGVLLILANCVKNAFDFYLAQPITHMRINVDSVTQETHEFIASIEPSRHRLPAEYVPVNLVFYAALVLGIILCRVASTVSLKHARKIHDSIPLTRANTADLPAPDSLVRASSEPLQEQQTVLLRAAVQGQETSSEQLVRAVGGQK